MTATFLAFNVANRAMEASQATINVTGNNIANINTEGYTRQRVDINAITISGQTQKYATPQISTGIGAKAVGTTQLRDPFIDARYRAQNAETSRYDTMVSGLSDLEEVFDEASTEALQGELSSFTEDLQSLSQTPTSPDIAQVVRSAAQKVTQMMNMYANQIDQVRVEQVEDLGVVASDFNTYVKNIANLNDQIRNEEIYGNTPNELYDQRNLLIDKLAGIADIKISSNPEKVSEDLTIERLSISLYNPKTTESITIVNNDKYSTLGTEDVGTGVVMTLTSTDTVDHANVNDFFTDGTVKGYLNIINGKGSFAGTGESDVRGISYYQNMMDIFANNFAVALNDINTITVGTPEPLFTDENNTTTNITAKSIQVSKAWLADPSYINNTNTTATTTSGANDNILRMVSAMTGDHEYYKPGESKLGGDVPLFTGSYHEYMTGLLGDLATDVELNTNFAETANGVLETIFNARESESGVSLNEEGTNLMAFQKVYNAAIRYFTVLDENVDAIINKMGLVGR